MSEGFYDLYRRNIRTEIIGCMPDCIARECRAIPVDWDDDGLVVAMADPDDDKAIERLRFTLNTPMTVVLATPQAIQYAIQRYYPSP